MIPLVFDLDGTLHADDLSWLDFRRALVHRPWLAIATLPLAAFQRGRLKCAIAAGSDFDVRKLCWDDRVLRYAREQKDLGRTLVLATGTAQRLACQVADYVGCFSLVLGSSFGRNFVGSAKEEELVSRYGRYGFDYVGNSSADLNVWRSAHHSVVCNAPASVLTDARRIGNVIHVIPPLGVTNYPL